SISLGNIISITWRGRLEDHLGKFNVLSHESVYPFVYANQMKMISLMSLCDLFYVALAEKEPQKVLYGYLEDFLYSIKYDESYWLNRLLFIELELLSHIGFGLDLEKCAVSNKSEGLSYISPKTGRAVSKEVGEQYKDKLFYFPKVLQDFESDDIEELFYALKITKYFLEKNLDIPESRNKLEQILQKEIDGLKLQV
ncbi:MAG: DNA repair protein RecO, partial [Alphaproteobacteria bacterium]|nr:DNA repair protein RecO [Alphaproteobacteria bacterium]